MGKENINEKRRERFWNAFICLLLEMIDAVNYECKLSLVRLNLCRLLSLLLATSSVL
jgi:hypothetical protein